MEGHALTIIGIPPKTTRNLTTVSDGTSLATNTYLANSSLVGQIVFASNTFTRMTPTHYGEERREAQEAKALRLLREQMGRWGCEEGSLRQAGQGDERKVRLAARFRAETTMSLKWMVQHLEMGSWTHVSNLLVSKRKQESLKSEN